MYFILFYFSRIAWILWSNPLQEVVLTTLFSLTRGRAVTTGRQQQQSRLILKPLSNQKHTVLHTCMHAGSPADS